MKDSARSRREGWIALVLLWPGQFVSALGDAFYRIALGFVLLAETGSTAVTGAVLAASMLPKIILGPMAGAAADRFSRKRLLVTADLLCGGAMLAVGGASLSGGLEVWMLVAAAVVLGTGAVFVGTTLETALPELCHQKSLSRVNAAFSFASTGAALVGNASGGFVFLSLGAASLFLFNGLSFVCSALLTSFAIIPIPLPSERSPSNLWRQLRQGFATVSRSLGLIVLIAGSSVANFFVAGVFFGVLALCEARPELGPGAYGLLMAALSVGAIAGYVVMAAYSVPARRRFGVFCGSGAMLGLCFSLFAHLCALGFMLPVLSIAGFAISVNGTLCTTALQLKVGATERGKVLGLRASLSTALSPAGIAAAGMTAAVIDVAWLMTFSAIAIMTIYTTMGLARPVAEILGAEREAN